MSTERVTEESIEKMPFTLICMRSLLPMKLDTIRITSREARALEQKLNCDTLCREWIKLGDMFFAWRFDPFPISQATREKFAHYFHSEAVATELIVSGKQFDWISNELKKLRKYTIAILRDREKCMSKHI